MILLRQILKDRSAAHALLAIAVWLLAVAAPLATTSAATAASGGPLCAEIAAGGGKAADLPHALGCAVHCHAVPAAPLAATPPAPGQPIRSGGVAAGAVVAEPAASAGREGLANRARAPPSFG